MEFHFLIRMSILKNYIMIKSEINFIPNKEKKHLTSSRNHFCYAGNLTLN